MAITKTDFIEYTRCPRYVALEEIKKEALDADIDYETYLEKDLIDNITDIYNRMYEETEEGDIIDKIDVTDIQLEAMQDYYKKVEIEAGRIAEKEFGGKTKYAEKTHDQECFDTNINGIRYLCYVDIYNEVNDKINIIEVKATTSNKFAKLEYSHQKEKYQIFKKIGNVYHLIEELNEYIPDIDKYNKCRNKLFNRFDEGKYVFDLAVQRYIIEHEYMETGNIDKLDNINYYLGVLNHEYVFDGTYENIEPVYNQDNNGNEIITFIDMNTITKEYQPIIDEYRKALEKNLKESNATPYPLGDYCCYKKRHECKFFKKICGECIPDHYSSLTYMNNGNGFDTGNGRIKGLDLINEGYLNMLDIPEAWIKNPNHFIQRNSLKNDREYIDHEKIKYGLSKLKYPIYHLDFETFPCPMPRFRGEKPYSQSVFEFSLHIEREPGICDNDLDNHVYLARNHKDCRKELIEKLLEWTENQEGTLFAQNISFEHSRIKELAQIFPEYQERLEKLNSNYFDLIWLVEGNKKVYTDFERETINYYHKDLNGSFSIKKTLPVFSDLSYSNLDVKNGTEAIVTYANYPHMTKEERELKYNSLITYCKQDTWAMVVILNSLRNL